MVYSYKGLMRVNMNYYIEKHDMEIILDALENLVEDMKQHPESNIEDAMSYGFDEWVK